MSTRTCCSPPVSDSACPAGPLTRPHFFAGQCLTEDDLNAMQDYFVERQQRHNRYLHGVGVVNGLQVCSHRCPGWLNIMAGFAIGPCGEEIFVPETFEFDLCSAIKDKFPNFNNCDGRVTEHEWQVRIRYAETECRGTTPTALQSGKCGCGCGDSGNSTKTARCRCQTTNASSVIECHPSRIRECFRIDVVPAPNAYSRGTSGSVAAETFASRVKRCLGESTAMLEQANKTLDIYKALIEQGDTSTVIWQATADDLHEKLRQVLSRHDCTAIIPTCNPCSSPEGFRTYLNEVKDFLKNYKASCICNALLPSPPEPANSSELVLATVKTSAISKTSGCKITHICNLKGRQQMITLPTLEYWVSMVPDLWKRLELFCCAPNASRDTASLLASLNAADPKVPESINAASTNAQILSFMLQILFGKK